MFQSTDGVLIQFIYTSSRLQSLYLNVERVLCGFADPFSVQWDTVFFSLYRYYNYWTQEIQEVRNVVCESLSLSSKSLLLMMNDLLMNEKHL